MKKQNNSGKQNYIDRRLQFKEIFSQTPCPSLFKEEIQGMTYLYCDKIVSKKEVRQNHQKGIDSLFEEVNSITGPKVSKYCMGKPYLCRSISVPPKK